MTTLGAMLDQVLAKSGSVKKLPSGSFTLPGATTVTSTDHLRNPTGYATTSFQSNFQWRPTAATANGADYIRRVILLSPSTGTYTIDASVTDVTATSEDIYLLPPWLHPQRVIDAANLALEKLYTANIEPVSHKPISTGTPDAGFQSTATTFYTASGSTFSKHSTQNSERVLEGLGSGRVLNAGYIMQQHAATPGEPVYVYAAASVAVGSASLVLRDSTNSATIGTTLASSQRNFHWIVRREQVPTGCYLVEPRLTTVGASDDVYWGGQCTLFPEQNQILLDTKWDSEFKATRLVAARWGGTSTSNGVYPAMAGDYIPIPEKDYSLYIEKAGPNPTRIVWHNNAQRHWYQYPVFIDGRRNYADFTTALTLASWATDVPIDKDLWDAATRLELFGMDDILSAHPDNLRKLAKARSDFGDVNVQTSKHQVTRGRVFTGSMYVRN